MGSCASKPKKQNSGNKKTKDSSSGQRLGNSGTPSANNRQQHQPSKASGGVTNKPLLLGLNSKNGKFVGEGRTIGSSNTGSDNNTTDIPLQELDPKQRAALAAQVSQI